MELTQSLWEVRTVYNCAPEPIRSRIEEDVLPACLVSHILTVKSWWAVAIILELLKLEASQMALLPF